ncbi:hypothetical protein [Streptomyces sp. 6N223]
MGFPPIFIWDHSETLDKAAQHLSEHETQVLEEVDAEEAVESE